MLDFQTRILTCKDCGEEFVFTADAQQYFSDRKLNHEPKLCKPCYLDSRRQTRSRSEHPVRPHVEVNGNVQQPPARY